VLDHIDLTVDRGSLQIIDGSNGLGKTALLRMACGPTSPHRWQHSTRLVRSTAQLTLRQPKSA
jgi:ABC-type transport system involved in cytochrome c biogenesis ATPase subunit